MRTLPLLSAGPVAAVASASASGRTQALRVSIVSIALVCATAGLLTGVPSSHAAEPASTNAWAPFVEPGFPFISSVIDGRQLGAGTPTNNITPRGLVLNLGHGAWAGFDTDLLRVAAIWVGEGPGVTPVSMSQISYQVPGAKVSEGEKVLPQPVGSPWIASGIYPGWQLGSTPVLADPRPSTADPRQVGRGPLPIGKGRFQAVRQTSGGLRLEYTIGGSSIAERIDAQTIDGGAPVVERQFRIDRVPEALVLVLGEVPSAIAGQLQVELLAATRADGVPVAEWVPDPTGVRAIRVPRSSGPIEFSVAFGARAAGASVKKVPAPVASVPAVRRWPESVITRVESRPAAADTSAYVVENIPPPTVNPWRRNVRFADLAFLGDGTAMAVTFDGDVWRITGLRGDLAAVKWERFASGLQEPMSLCVRDGEVFVFDRHGIWRLRDTDGNGEADAHELFANGFTQGAETREYAQSIRVAPEGSFVIAKGGIQFAALGRDNGSVLRVSRDGTAVETLGYGLRSPFAAVHPVTGLVTASDQQGNYVPTTPVHVVGGGSFHGFLSTLQPKEQYPAPITEPLTWIPYPVNASGAGQVWLAGARMGPLNDALIHVGYYRPEIFAILINHRATRPQAAVVSVTRDLQFAPLNAAVNPVDGQLYVIGLQIWGSVAKQVTGLARVRYTGAPSTLPREVVAMAQGILVRFDTPLDPAVAADPANYSIERWNYRRTAAYGSPHFKPDGTKGQESLVPASAVVSSDGRSVFVGVPGMAPVMQMRLGWSLALRDGRRFEQNAYFSPRELPRLDPVAEGFGNMEIDLRPRKTRAAGATPVTVEEGRRLAELMGCAACHSTDGSTLGKVGPTWKGLSGSSVALADGTRVIADSAYLRESIREPSAKVVKDYDKSETAMPSYEGLLSEAQVEALVLYLQAL